MIHQNELKLIVSFDKADDIDRSFRRGECYINFADESLSLMKIKTTVRDCFNIPASLDFELAVFQPFDTNLETKYRISGRPFGRELQSILATYIIESDVYGYCVESLLHLHLYPLNFQVIPFIFTLNEQFPSEGLIDYPLTKAIQGYPLAYIGTSWTFLQVIDHFQQLVYHYIYESIPAVMLSGNKTLLQEQCRQYEMEFYSLSGVRIVSMEAFLHNEPVTVKVVRGDLTKLRIYCDKLEWFETPLLPPFAIGKADSSDHGFITPEEFDSNHGMTINPSNLSSLSREELNDTFQKCGVQLTPSNMTKLLSRSSTVANAMEYYFDHPEQFPDVEEEKRIPDSMEMALPSAPVAVEDNDIPRQNSPSPYEIIEAEDCEELSYFDGDQNLPDAVVHAIIPHGQEPAFPPPPPALHPPHSIGGYASANAITFSDPKYERYYYRFKELGFELNELQLNELLLRASTFDGMINYYLSNLSLFYATGTSPNRTATGSKRSHTPVYEKQCLICFGDYPMEEMYGLNCCANHYFCISCLLHLLRFAINGSEDTAAHIPACPLANRKEDGCAYVVQEHECQQIIQLAADSKSLETFTYSDAEQLIKKMKRLYLVRAYYAANCVRCPSCPSEFEDEAYWISLPPTGRKKAMRVNCETCYASFCSACLKFPYHYGCRCEEVMPYMRAWMEWIGTGRQRYLQELSKHESKYRDMMKEYEQKKNEHDKKVKEAEDRFREFQASELELSKFCRACPYCGFRIEKIDGCDSMKCGQDYHGNSLGLGCGKTFSWTAAPAYKPNLADRKMPEELNVVPPEKAYEIRHEIEEGVPLPCDYCNSPIVGPKIQCLNCPCYTLCLNCSTNVSFDIQDPFGHHNSHTCKVVYEK